jgi:hypothetical protein
MKLEKYPGLTGSSERIFSFIPPEQSKPGDFRQQPELPRPPRLPGARDAPDKQIKSFGRFMMLWAGDFYTNTASGLTAFTLGIFMFEMTGKAASVALTTLCAFLPIMLLNPLTGVLADRFDRRLMMILGDGCSALEARLHSTLHEH